VEKYGLLQFDQWEEITRAGYDAAVEQLKNFQL